MDEKFKVKLREKFLTTTQRHGNIGVEQHVKNRIEVNMKFIPVRFAIVDDDDYEELVKYNWNLTRTGHVARFENGKMILMHRVVVCAQAGMEVDHINGVAIDNQKLNLRECSHAENMKNRRSNIPGKSSKYKGVHRGGKYTWRVSIQVDGKRVRLGNFKDEKLAAEAYDAAARYYHGEFAKTNFPGTLALSADEIKRRK